MSTVAGTPGPAEDIEDDRGGSGRVLDAIERLGNKVPHPGLIFLALIVGVIVLSHILYLTGASVTATSPSRAAIPPRPSTRGAPPTPVPARTTRV